MRIAAVHRHHTHRIPTQNLTSRSSLTKYSSLSGKYRGLCTDNVENTNSEEPQENISAKGDSMVESELDVKASPFSKLGLSPLLVNALHKSHPHIEKPMAIQKMVIPKILDRSRDIIFASQTGSGKTLAYLLPILQHLKEDEGKVEKRECRPSALVIVPSRPLADQVLSVVKSLSHFVKIRSASVCGGRKDAPQKRALATADLITCTPGRLMEMMRRDRVKEIVRKQFPGVEVVVGPKLHKTVPKLKQHFIEVKTTDKLQPLLRVMQSNTAERTIVFCNTVDSCRATEHFLREQGYKTTTFHGAMLPKQREEAWESFQSGHVKVLVATDIASRGLDTTYVDHVILFDFPWTPIEYLHRIGRTARANRPGKITSLVKKSDKVLADAIQAAIRKGIPLESLSNNKSDYVDNNPKTAKLR